MKPNTFAKATLLAIALTGLGSVMAQDQLRSQDTVQLREQIYSYEHMTQRERDSYLERMRLARTEQEREQIRAEHREKMDLRMRSQNQNKPAPSGSGMGKNQGGNAPIIPPKPGSGRN